MAQPHKMVREKGRQALDEGLAALTDLPRRDLVARWQTAFGKAPPKNTSRGLMVRALAYGLQEQHEGGLSQSALNRLRLALTPEGTDGSPPRGFTRHLKPGTRLVREWHGAAYHVTVLEKGFAYQGEVYRSLSKIARMITGTRRSGPLFFGLRDG